MDNAIRATRAAKASTEGKKLRRHPDVVGIGYGPKEKDGALTSDVAVKLYVRKKREAPENPLPEKLDDVNTDVVEIAPLRARASFTSRLRPILGGASGAVHVPGLTYTGTLGMAVRGYGSYEGRFFVLSNNHVLANVNEASVGDAVIQPGTLDGGDPDDDVIGELFEYEPLRFGDPQGDPDSWPVNAVDAAMAEIDFGTMSREIFWLGYPKGWRLKEHLVDDVAGGDQIKVQKTGRTTAYTTGVISDVGYDGWVNYDHGRLAYFEDQILIKPGTFSDRGDSGSVIVDMDERIVGLLYAGGATHTIANHIEDVWQRISALEFSDDPS